MTFPIFAAGDVLRATDMNACGLWLVKTQTIGTGVATQVVTGAFTGDYEAYLIQVSGGVSSATTTLGLRLGSKVTNYRYQFMYGSWTNTPLAVGSTTGDRFEFAGSCDANGLTMNCTVINPQLAKATRAVGDSTQSGNYSGNMTGYDPDITQYTAFTILPGSGTLTGGTIRVYGYQK
jgi:hypothetical protein